MYRGSRGGRTYNSSIQKNMKVFQALPEFLKYLFLPQINMNEVAVATKHAIKPMTGLGSYLEEFESMPAVTEKGEAFIPPAERRKKWREECTKKRNLEIEEKKKEYNPLTNPKATEVAMNTLFIGNLSYSTSESRLREVFERYGTVKNIRMVTDFDGKPRGYAFVEFGSEDELRIAYSNMRSFELDGRMLIIDVERGRTVRDWIPARLGGGKGNSRAPRPKKERHTASSRAFRRDEGRRDEGRRDFRRDDGRRDFRRDDGRRDFRRDEGRRDYRRDEGRRDYRRDDGRRDFRRDEGRRDFRRDEGRRDYRRDDRENERRDRRDY